MNSEITPTNALLDRERVRGAARTIIAPGTRAVEVTNEQAAAVASEIELFARANGIRKQDVATAIGYQAADLSRFLGGRYSSAGQMAIDLQAWLVEEETRREQRQPTQFVWTEVAKTIKAVATFALDFKKIGLIYGPDTSGIGKTTSLRAIHQELGPRRSALLTVDKVDVSPVAILRKVCTAIGKSTSGSNAERMARITEYLRGRSHLLMVDQIHSLCGAKDDRPLWVLTDIYDRTETAQLCSGTADMVAYLDRRRVKNSDESLAQIRRRVFPRVDLMSALRADGGGGGKLLVTVDQVREMFANNKLRLTDSAARFLCRLANTPDSGGVGLCVQLVQYGTILAERRGAGFVDVDDLRGAMQIGFAPAQVEQLLAASIEEQAARIAAAG